MSAADLAYQIKHSDRYTFAFLAIITLLARLIPMFRLTIDYDETTYAVIADHMIKGAVLYKDVIDIKQPGIFLIFGLIQLVFGKSVVMIRLVSAMTIASSAYLLYRTKRELHFDFNSSFLSAVSFILMFNFYFGFATNTEVFFIFYSSLGIYLFFTASSTSFYFLSGLAFGVGFIIKQHTAFDFVALGFFFFITSLIRTRLWRDSNKMALMAFGFLLPPSAVHITFWISGYYEYYHFISYTAPGNYSNHPSLATSLAFLAKGLLVYLPFVLAALAGIKSRIWSKDLLGFIFLLSSMSFMAIVITGKSHQHYYLQMVYPISFAAGELISLNWVNQVIKTKYFKSTALAVAAIYLIFVLSFYYNRYIIRPNKAEDLVGYLEGKITPEMEIYTGDAPQYLYWHFDKLSPTAYIHSSVLTKRSNIFTLDIDLTAELDKIYNGQPDIIILSEGYPYKWFSDKIKENYRLLGQVHEFNIYQK